MAQLVTFGTKNEVLTSPVASDLRQLTIQFNNLMANLAVYIIGENNQGIVASTVLSRGSTDTNLASTAFTFNIAGVQAAKAAVAAGTAFGALGTVPADTWALIAAEIVAAGTISFVSAAANYTTGYTSEALAIAANPAITAAKSRMGYITLKTKAATAWVAGTDALAGGATGNPASITNYYPTVGMTDAAYWTCNAIANRSGTIVSAANY